MLESIDCFEPNLENFYPSWKNLIVVERFSLQLESYHSSWKVSRSNWKNSIEVGKVQIKLENLQFISIMIEISKSHKDFPTWSEQSISRLEIPAASFPT